MTLFDKDLDALVVYIKFKHLHEKKKQRGLYQSKVTSNLAAIQRQGDRAAKRSIVMKGLPALTWSKSLCHHNLHQVHSLS